MTERTNQLNILSILGNMIDEDIPSSHYSEGKDDFIENLTVELTNLYKWIEDSNLGENDILHAFSEGLSDAILKAREDENKK
jgi:hypothetical protein